MSLSTFSGDEHLMTDSPAAKALGYHYASTFGIGVVCVRIGNFNKDRPEPLHPHSLGHVDCAQVFRQALTHPLAARLEAGKEVCHEVVYGALSLPPMCYAALFLLCLLRLSPLTRGRRRGRCVGLELAALRRRARPARDRLPPHAAQ
jgi:hypothetical protein